MKQGWSIVPSYIEPNNTSMQEIFALVHTSVAIIKPVNGQVYWPQYNLNLLGNMQRGQGYQLKAINAFDLYYLGNH